MATTLVTCPACGDIELHSTDFTVTTCMDTLEATATYTCCICAQRRSYGPLTEIQIELLLHSGADILLWEMPTASKRPDVDELTELDADRFAATLEQWNGELGDLVV